MIIRNAIFTNRKRIELDGIHLVLDKNIAIFATFTHNDQLPTNNTLYQLASQQSTDPSSLTHCRRNQVRPPSLDPFRDIPHCVHDEARHRIHHQMQALHPWLLTLPRACPQDTLRVVACQRELSPCSWALRFFLPVARKGNACTDC